MNKPKVLPHRSFAHRVLTMVGITGIAALLLPFTYDVSPALTLTTFEWFFLQIGLPFFLSIFAFTASIRWIISGSFSRFEQVAAYVLSTGMAFLTVYFLLTSVDDSWPSEVYDWLVFLVPAALLLFGVFVLIRNWKLRRVRGYTPVMAIQVAYLPNAALCLIGFFVDEGWQIGAYCVLVTAVAYLTQIILVSRKDSVSVGREEFFPTPWDLPRNEEPLTVFDLGIDSDKGRPTPAGLSMEPIPPIGRRR